MGSSKFITIAQAAKILGVAERSIYRYGTRGILQAKCEGTRTYILEEDVLAHKKGRRDALSVPLQRDIISKQQAEIQTLKTQMATVMRILNIRFDPFDFTVPEYENLYRAAEQMSREGWAPHAEDMWSEYFVRFRVEDFEKIEIATGDKHPWRPLLRLVSTMHVNPWNPELIEMFAAGKTNIQQVAGVWCVLKEESPRAFNVLQDRDATPFKKLIKQMKKS